MPTALLVMDEHCREQTISKNLTNSQSFSSQDHSGLNLSDNHDVPAAIINETLKTMSSTGADTLNRIFAELKSKQKLDRVRASVELLSHVNGVHRGMLTLPTHGRI